ncbi:helix-turn-helix domain-containing protein [Bifidobacterium callimiconis]|uniref:helix-turn-helix domain-containing protein n=1 Tax=Bifidobacterium callimiconis TaxID=2306973 RepID=UPI001BDCD674|nr:helix-turn-helix domain-containing protein [Bifidobacterium callimiconis]MBT1176994.1 helix-turn-helix domain-containing protein [Bifidobacterium callimiconis]
MPTATKPSERYAEAQAKRHKAIYDTVWQRINAAVDKDMVTMTPDEAAAYLNLTAAFLNQLRYKNEGPTYLKPGAKTVIYLKKDLDDWLKKISVTTD